MTKTTQNWKIGDCLKLMKEMKPNSVDLIVTDPPYGYSFMGKDWDRAVPTTKLWEEALRVLKPGAFAFIMSAPRQDVLAHNLVNLSDAGFNTSFTSIYWTYASGFPKASNISKMVDKRRSCDVSNYIKNSNKSNKEIAKYCKVSSTLVRLWELNKRQIMLPEWLKLKKILKINNHIFDENLKKVKRDVIKKGTNYKHQENKTGYGFKDKFNITISSTSQAKELDGSYGGFQPKPAVEVIMVVMKPLSEKTYGDQAMTNQKGITWLDDGRIPYQNDADKEGARFGTQMDIRGVNLKSPIGIKAKNVLSSTKGRFPANLLVCDDVLNDGKITKSSDAIRHNNQDLTSGKGIYGKYNQKDTCGYSDFGSFSRYFDLDAWWNEQIKHLPKEVQKTFPFIITPKASKSEKNDSVHPTIKPVKLFTYLMTIGSRPGDLVLDPFLGSGTALQSGRLLDRSVIGYELDPQWETGYNSRAMKNIPTLLSFG